MLKYQTRINRIVDCAGCGTKFTTSETQKKFCTMDCRVKTGNYKWKRPNPYNLSTGTIGAIAELAVCNKLMNEGNSVFRAVSPSCFCDIISFKDGKTTCIEVRTAKRNLSGTFAFPKSRPREGVDLYALYLPESQEIHFIPYPQLTNSNSLAILME